MAELTMNATCTMSATDPRDNGPDPPLFPCGERSVAVITFACVHEHVNLVSACAGCCAEVQQCTGILICPRCEDGPGPHECLCLVVIDWDSGEKTIVQEPGRAQLEDR